jgi:cytochrome P450
VAFLLFSAGLDTVVSSLGFVFRTLAEDQELQAKLRATPDDLPRHLEEMMRLFSPVTVQRVVVSDTVVNGVAMKAGDRVAVSLACASRDSAEFVHPTELDATRNPNPHFGFGYGIHRCAGAQLARRDLVIALEEWFKRIPTFRLAPDSKITAAGGSVLCLDGVVLEWD